MIKEIINWRSPEGILWGAGTQSWYDWGSADQDWYLLDNYWYYLYLKRAGLFAEIAGKTNDIPQYSKRMQSIEANFNNYFWQTSGYWSPDYAGPTDDRGNALSIYSGLASKEKWNTIALSSYNCIHCKRQY